MPDFLGHAENPLREEEWARLNETVIQVARRSLVGRRILDIYGPLGAGVQTVPHDEYQGVSPGAVDIVGEQETRHRLHRRAQVQDDPHHLQGLPAALARHRGGAHRTTCRWTCPPPPAPPPSARSRRTSSSSTAIRSSATRG